MEQEYQQVLLQGIQDLHNQFLLKLDYAIPVNLSSAKSRSSSFLFELQRNSQNSEVSGVGGAEAEEGELKNAGEPGERDLEELGVIMDILGEL